MDVFFVVVFFFQNNLGLNVRMNTRLGNCSTDTLAVSSELLAHRTYFRMGKSRVKIFRIIPEFGILGLTFH